MSLRHGMVVLTAHTHFEVKTVPESRPPSLSPGRHPFFETEFLAIFTRNRFMPMNICLGLLFQRSLLSPQLTFMPRWIINKVDSFCFVLGFEPTSIKKTLPSSGYQWPHQLCKKHNREDD
jgi:hypothetical protein